MIVMRHILLPFFLIRLGLSLGWSSLRLIYYQLPPLASFCLAGLFLVWAGLFSPIIPKPLTISRLLSPTLAVTQADPPIVTPENIKNYQANLELWLQVAQLQPTHRDVLLNLAYLYQALGNNDKYQEFRQRAQRVDPNNSAFKTN